MTVLARATTLNWIRKAGFQKNKESVSHTKYITIRSTRFPNHSLIRQRLMDLKTENGQVGRDGNMQMQQKSKFV